MNETTFLGPGKKHGTRFSVLNALLHFVQWLYKTYMEMCCILN